MTIHLLLAEQVLEHWRAHPTEAPFSLSDPIGLNAFRQGAFGPDLGYFPGGFRPLSDLAHCFQSGDLVRCLVSTARTPLERGFAWGWAAHLLADVSIHPLIAQPGGSLRSRYLPQLASLAVGLSVGVSRCYLGVHYPGDVAVGWILAVVSAIPFGLGQLIGG